MYLVDNILNHYPYFNCIDLSYLNFLLILRYLIFEIHAELYNFFMLCEVDKDNSG